MSSFTLYIGGQEVPQEKAEAVRSVEVEENADRPDAMTISLAVNRAHSGDLTFVDDGSFKPYQQVAVVLKAGESRQCVFDGYALSWQLHLDRASADSTLQVWAQDASWLMNINDVVKEWSGLTDGQVASWIFETHGFIPAAGNTEHDSPIHLAERHTLFQRATDLRFLYGLARRNGKICRVACGTEPGLRTGYFIRPDLDRAPAATISLTGQDSWNVDALDMEWDVMRPTAVRAAQAPQAAAAGSAPLTATTSGLPVLGGHGLRDYAGRKSATLLTATADQPELRDRMAAVLIESGWFARCTGEADLDRLGTVLRAGMIVRIDGAGQEHSGSWLVWQVNHLIKSDSCRARFTLVRNGMGAGGGGGL